MISCFITGGRDITVDSLCIGFAIEVRYVEVPLQSLPLIMTSSSQLALLVTYYCVSVSRMLVIMASAII